MSLTTEQERVDSSTEAVVDGKNTAEYFASLPQINMSVEQYNMLAMIDPDSSYVGDFLTSHGLTQGVELIVHLDNNTTRVVHTDKYGFFDRDVEATHAFAELFPSNPDAKLKDADSERSTETTEDRSEAAKAGVVDLAHEAVNLTTELGNISAASAEKQQDEELIKQVTDEVAKAVDTYGHMLGYDNSGVTKLETLYDTLTLATREFDYGDMRIDELTQHLRMLETELQEVTIIKNKADKVQLEHAVQSETATDSDEVAVREQKEAANGLVFAINKAEVTSDELRRVIRNYVSMLSTTLDTISRIQPTQVRQQIEEISFGFKRIISADTENRETTISMKVAAQTLIDRVS
jgi:hypothetical protein